MKGRSFELRFPRDFTERHVEAVLAAVQALPAAGPGRLLGPAESVLLDTVADSTGVRNFITIGETYVPVILSALRAAHGSVRTVESVVPSRPARAVTRSLEYRRTRATPWRTGDLPAIAASLLAALQPLGSGEELRLQLILAPFAFAPSPGVVRLAQTLAGTRPTTKASKPEAPRLLTCLRISASGRNEVAAWALLRRVRAVLASLRQDGTSLAQRRLPGGVVSQRMALGLVPRWWPMTAIHLEVATLLSWPIAAPLLPGVRLHGTRVLPRPAELPTSGRVLGTSLASSDNNEPIAMSWEAAHRHTLLLAPTGSGKTTLMVNLALQAVAAGKSLVVIDPKLDLVTEIAERLSAEALLRTVLLDPGSDYPVGFNPFAHATNPELVVDQVVGLFAAIFASGWGPRSEDLSRHLLRTIAASGRLTILEAARLMNDERLRWEVLATVDDPIGIGEFWEHFTSLGDAEQRQVIAPLSNKLRALTSRPHLRHVLGQLEPGWSMAEMMNGGGIVLVSLDRAGMGQEAARLFGSLVLSEVWQATLGRGAIDRTKWHPVELLVDELPELVGSPAHLEEFLTQARSFRVGMTAAMQTFAQVSPTLRAALLGARTRLTFAPAADDARILAREFQPHLRAEDLINLGGFEVAGMVATDSGHAVPITAATAPLPPATSSRQAVEAASRRFGRPRAEIEAELRARRQPPGGGPLGRVRRSS